MWQRHVCCRSADGSQPRRLLHHKGWAQCGSGAPLRRHVPFRVVPERPVTRLAHWGWRAAGTQRLTLLRVSAALWLRLGRSRLSAARSSRLRGRVGAFARCALLVKGGPDGATRKGLRAWRSLQAEAARYGLKYFGLCPPPRAWWHMWCTLSSTELDERAQGRKATRQGLVLPGRLPALHLAHRRQRPPRRGGGAAYGPAGGQAALACEVVPDRRLLPGGACGQRPAVGASRARRGEGCPMARR